MTTPDVRGSRVIGLTLLVGIFFTAQRLLMTLASGRRPPGLSFDILQELLYWGVWALLGPLVLALARRFPLHGRPSLGAVAVHLGSSLVLAPAHSFVAFGLHRVLTLALATDPVVREQVVSGQSVGVVWGVFMGFFWYWVMVALATTVRLRHLYAAERLAAADLAGRSATLEAQLARAQLDALRAQLHPHFLFNTLNTISVLAAEQGDKARQMILRLASLLRRSLDEAQDEVTLEQELSILEDYLDIQRVRFGDRLAIRITVDAEARQARVPVLFLQPLIENVIQHATWGRDDATTIALSATRLDGTLAISVEDDGPGPRPAAVGREGIGLGNTRERLRRLYGDRASLTLASGASHGTRPGARVDLRIPFASASG